MTSACRRAGVLSGIALCVMLTGGGATGRAFAQATTIVPTPGEVGTGGLGTVASQGGNRTTITGGLRPGEGPNVFHSFNQFSVGAGDVAAFQNPGGASRVISRVIGGSPSNINGTIEAIGWNLYFMNPSGVIFGPSANLSVSGSAYFSTASQLRLGDGQIFSTNFIALDATLSTAAPAAFGFVGASAPAPIVISGSTLTISNATLMVAGGSVQLNGATISAQRAVVGAVGAGAEANVDPGAGNAFIANTPAGTLSASVGSRIQGGFSAEVFPADIVVPPGARVNRTTGIFGFLTGVEVVGGPGSPPPGSSSGLPPVVFPTATANTAVSFANQNPVDPVVYLNRAATILPQDAPARPLALLTSRCAGGQKGEFSSFIQASRDATPPQPGNTLASPFIWDEPTASLGVAGHRTMAQRSESSGLLTVHATVGHEQECGS